MQTVEWLTSSSGCTVKCLARSMRVSRSRRRRSRPSSFSRANSCWRRIASSAARLRSSAIHGDDCQSLIRTGRISKIRLHPHAGAVTWNNSTLNGMNTDSISTSFLSSVNTNLLPVPRVRITFASRGFNIAVWNSLPSVIHHSSSTHILSVAFL